MYADNILLLSPSVLGLRKMLDKCTDVFNKKLPEFNVSKSACIIVGPASKCFINPLELQQKSVEWKDSLKYLGVNFNLVNG